MQSPVGLDDLLSVAQGSLPVLHVQADAHGLVHHVKHIHVTVLEHAAHLLLAELADLQQLTRGCCGVKDPTGLAVREEASQGLAAGGGRGAAEMGPGVTVWSTPPPATLSEKVNYRKPSK